MVTSLVLIALMAGASQETTSISGVITDTTGRRLPGATVVTTSDDGTVRRTTTDLSGQYHFGGLQAGRFRIEVSMHGFETKARDLSVVSARDETWGGALLVGPPLGAGSIERRLMSIVGWNARDCGRHNTTASQTSLQRSLQCAVASAQAGDPFAVIVQSTESAQAGFGLLAENDGVAHVFWYDKGGLTFHSQPCPSEQLTVRRHAFACTQ